jgi:HK97 family phage major capsid protein
VAKTVIPTNASELEEMLGDQVKVGQLMKDGQWSEFMTNYARVVMNKDKELGAQVREQTQLVVAEMMGQDKVNGDVKRLNQAALQNKGGQFSYRKNSIYNKNAPGASIDNVFDSTADFFRSIWHNRETLPDSESLGNKAAQVKKIQNSFGTKVPADGGFLVPEVLRAEILAVALENSVVRQRARVIPMESQRLPIPMVDSTSNASTVFGGITCYWTEEGAAATDTSATFGQLVLQAHKLTGYAEVPNELMADAPAFGAFFDQMFPEAMAWYEDDAFFDGSGAGEPQGFLNCPASISVAKESGQAADTVVWENIVKMYSRMLPSSHKNAVWIVSPDVLPELATMALSVGTGGSAVWLQNGQGDFPMTILGRPVIVSEKVEKLGDAGDVNYVDLSYYIVGDRQQMTATSSPHFKFSSGKTCFLVTERVDGRVWLQSAITPKNSGATLSPFVSLAERA